MQSPRLRGQPRGQDWKDLGSGGRGAEWRGRAVQRQLGPQVSGPPVTATVARLSCPGLRPEPAAAARGHGARAEQSPGRAAGGRAARGRRAPVPSQARGAPPRGHRGLHQRGGCSGGMRLGGDGGLAPVQVEAGGQGVGASGHTAGVMGSVDTTTSDVQVLALGLTPLLQGRGLRTVLCTCRGPAPPSGHMGTSAPGHRPRPPLGSLTAPQSNAGSACGAPTVCRAQRCPLPAASPAPLLGLTPRL